MLVAATFLTVHFGQWRQSWHGMTRKTRTGISSLGELLWYWLATERGCDVSRHGQLRRLNIHRDFRSSIIGTANQTTHVNSALPVNLNGTAIILASLFHQGEMVSIDRASGRVT